MYVAGNAAATAGNVVANSGLVRMGVVADLLDGTFFVFLALALYMLLKHVHKSAARAMVVLVALAAAIICLNAVFEFEGLRVATGQSMRPPRHRGFECPRAAPARHPALRDPHRADLLRPLAGAARVSRLQVEAGFPRALGVLLVVAASATSWTCSRCSSSPTSARRSTRFIVIPSAIAEIWMVLYLLVVGVKTRKPKQRNLVPVLAS